MYRFGRILIPKVKPCFGNVNKLYVCGRVVVAFRKPKGVVQVLPHCNAKCNKSNGFEIDDPGSLVGCNTDG